MYRRLLENQIKKEMFKGKIQIVYGPRQVGKTTLIQKVAEEADKNYLFLSGDVQLVREIFSSNEPEKIKQIIGSHKVVVIDEAQNITNIGTSLKIMYDFGLLKKRQVLVTGSSSFDLKNKLAEPMTGRFYSYLMYPLSLLEIFPSQSFFDIKSNEETFLRYGFYPEVYNQNVSFMEQKLATLIESTLYKDVFVMEGIKKPDILSKLVKTLAINIAHTSTTRGLAEHVGTTSFTIDRYLDLLEKSFVIKRLYTFSRNKNNELKRAFKVFFYDIGFRNAVLHNFNRYDVRDDIGQVFENFFIMERLKFLDYQRVYSSKYFWQTYTGVELDYLEERNGKLEAFECKWTARRSKGAKIFQDEYKKEKPKVHVVTKDNYLNFLK